jgi:hypothetical protein
MILIYFIWEYLSLAGIIQKNQLEFASVLSNEAISKS